MLHHRRQRGGREPVRAGREQQVLGGGVAAGAGRERAAAEAAERSVDHAWRRRRSRRACSPRRVPRCRVRGRRCAAAGFALPEAVDQVGHLRRYGLADGVAHDDVVGSRGAWVGGDADHPLAVGQPLEGAGERGGDAQLDRAADLVRDPDGVGHRRDAVLGGAPDVGLVVGIRRREAVLEVARTRGGRLLDVPRRRHPDPAAFQLLGVRARRRPRACRPVAERGRGGPSNRSRASARRAPAAHG